jgi:hypothetical protein
VTVYSDCTPVQAFERLLAEGEYWRRVTMPDKSEGWIPEEYLVPIACNGEAGA